ncbi:hypothetical protein SDC9_180395 [bioreactor metagenome]|uniref:Uncharacterized protein n=1 Tax=bioreactor metagenome TaxID=1076179 RepID=A0A645H3L5_9ZZZZ
MFEDGKQDADDRRDAPCPGHGESNALTSHHQEKQTDEGEEGNLDQNSREQCRDCVRGF